MPPKRERYNALARSSTAGGRTHKGKTARRHRSSVGDVPTSLDTNAPTLDSKDVDAERALQAQRREALIGASTATLSGKKRKRLDAFIAKGLAKERKVELLKKLAESSGEVQDRAQLLSAATLGTGRAKSGKERLDGEEKKLERKRDRRLGLLKERSRGDAPSSDEDLDVDLDVDPYGFENDIDDPQGEQLEDPERRARIQAAAAKFAKPPPGPVIVVASNVTVGSALAKDKDGKPIVPVMRQRQRKRAKKTRSTPPPEESDFDSSACSNDEEEDEASGTPSSSAEEASAALMPHLDKGKGKATTPDVSDDVLQGAMHARGVAWLSAHDAEESDTYESESGAGDEEWYRRIAEAGEYESDDEEEDAVFREAMRARGMWVPEMDAEQDAQLVSSAAASGTTFATAQEGASGSAAEDEEMVDLPYLGFASEKEMDSAVSSDEDEAATSSSSSSPSTPRARTRQTRKNNVARAAGFKDWANAAVGLSGGADSTRDQEGSAHDGVAYKGPTPVAGLTQRVGDLGPQDGIARGPLGGPSKEVLTPFSTKYFAESKASADKPNKIRHVDVTRKDDVQEARLKLPVLAEEDLITRTILENPVTVLCGETGSGKTTQVPQFLYEAGFGSNGSDNPGMIGITQPRRVAALSMATRVGAELCLPSTRVSHQIRYDATVSPSTAIKFMTDGVLLRELAGDFLLSRYSAVLVDEAHERSTNTDVLIGVLSRVVKLRAQRWIDGVAGARPLRLIIMSATLRVADFAENTTLFPTPPPIINITARQHSVTLHFARKTKHDYVDEATKKAIKIHARLPPGGILIFLTGQQEIATVCKRLEGRFGMKAIEQRKRDRARRGKAAQVRHAEPEPEADAGERITLGARDGDVETEELDLGGTDESAMLALDVDAADLAEEDPDALDTDDEATPEDHDADLPDHLKDDSDVPLHILPLYSLLPSDKQLRVFAEPPEGTRLCVVATNVAETSLTIPGIMYVIDCGRAKERSYDSSSGVQSFNVQWVSKASAQQRAGRAGRTGPGHCYRLYSSAIFEDTLPQFAVPEILRTPVEGLVLQMHAMHLDSVANFPFPTPPNRDALRRAERMLIRLGALELADAKGSANKRIQAARVTDLGRSMSLFPLAPRLAKLLVGGHQHGCLPYVIALVAALNVGDPFIREQALVEEDDDDSEVTDAVAKGMRNAEARAKEERKAKNRQYDEARRSFTLRKGSGDSDSFRLLAAVGAYEYEQNRNAFCERMFLRPKAMEEIHKLRAQLTNIVLSRLAPGTDAAELSISRPAPPTSEQFKVLRQLLAATYVDQVAVRADLMPKSASAITSLATGRFMKAQLRGQKPSNWREAAYLVRSSPTAPVFIHPGSVFCSANEPPEWLVYDTLQTSASGKIWMKGCTLIKPDWLHELAKPLCSFSKPAEPKIGAAAVVEAAKKFKSTGQAATKEVVLVPTYGTGPAWEPDERNAGPGWDLPPFKATQTLMGGKWITQLL